MNGSFICPIFRFDQTNLRRIEMCSHRLSNVYFLAASSPGCEPNWKECNMLRRTGTNALPVVWEGETKMMLFLWSCRNTVRDADVVSENFRDVDSVVNFPVGTQQSFTQGGSTLRSNPLPFYIPLWQKRYPFGYLVWKNSTPFTYLV